jgi:hypothetical protein
VEGGIPNDHSSPLGRSRPGGSLAVSTRCLTKDSRSSETAILKGFGSGDVELAAIVMIEEMYVSQLTCKSRFDARRAVLWDKVVEAVACGQRVSF